jgi:cysteine synthase B
MTKTNVATHPLLAAVGRTPLVELDFLEGVPAGTTIHAKLEIVNPTGSLKDRPVVRMLTEALAEGHLDDGRRLLDSSSGNAGIAYAAFGAALGVPVSLVVPGNASKERLNRIRSHGAELILTDPIEGYDFAIAEAQRLAHEHPDRYWYANQYENENNWRAHFDGTGEEIVKQMLSETSGVPDAFVGGVGTGGSLTGIGRRLLRANPDLQLTTVIPETFPGIEGLKPLGSPGDLVPGILDNAIINDRVTVTSEDAAAMSRELAETGYFVGPSSGAYVHTALELARTGRYRRIVTLLCDTGERYLTTGMWSG